MIVVEPISETGKAEPNNYHDQRMVLRPRAYYENLFKEHDLDLLHPIKYDGYSLGEGKCFEPMACYVLQYTREKKIKE